MCVGGGGGGGGGGDRPRHAGRAPRRRTTPPRALPPHARRSAPPLQTQTPAAAQPAARRARARRRPGRRSSCAAAAWRVHLRRWASLHTALTVPPPPQLPPPPAPPSSPPPCHAFPIASSGAPGRRPPRPPHHQWMPPRSQAPTNPVPLALQGPTLQAQQRRQVAMSTSQGYTEKWHDADAYCATCGSPSHSVLTIHAPMIPITNFQPLHAPSHARPPSRAAAAQPTRGEARRGGHGAREPAREPHRRDGAAAGRVRAARPEDAGLLQVSPGLLCWSLVHVLS